MDKKESSIKCPSLFLLYLRLRKATKICLVWLKLWDNFVWNTEWPLSDKRLSSYGQTHLLAQTGEQPTKIKRKKKFKVNIDEKLGSRGKSFKKVIDNHTVIEYILFDSSNISFFTIV